MAGLNLSDSYLVLGSRVVHGLLNRWTDIFFLPQPAWGEAFNPNNATQTHSIFAKLKIYLFRHAKGKIIVKLFKIKKGHGPKILPSGCTFGPSLEWADQLKIDSSSVHI